MKKSKHLGIFIPSDCPICKGEPLDLENEYLKEDNNKLREQLRRCNE